MVSLLANQDARLSPRAILIEDRASGTLQDLIDDMRLHALTAENPNGTIGEKSPSYVIGRAFKVICVAT